MIPHVMDQLRAEWARRLFEARHAAGLSQDQLAERAQVSQAVISFIEAGRAPRDDIKIAIAGALGCDVLDLFPFVLEEQSAS